jgi:hypothetical protein
VRTGGVYTTLLLALAGFTASSSATSPPLKPGFPATFSGSGNLHWGHPAIADLGLTPGHKSIVFGSSGHKLYVVKYDGTLATGFPVTLPADIVSSPAVGDLDGDGISDIVVGYGSTFEPTSPGGVRAFRRDGSILWDRPMADTNGDGIPDSVQSTPAIGDVDGDGLPEVVWGSFDFNVYVVRGRDGSNKPGWPQFVRDSIYSSPALADLDGDGKLEIIIGSDAHLEGPPYNTPNGGCLRVFRYDGSVFPGWPVCVDQVITSSPAVGDIDGDGRPEIVVGTGGFWPSASHVVYAFRTDGTAEPGWPVAVDGQVFTSPALADLDGDGIPEVVVTDDNSSPSTTYHVYGFKGNGTRLFKTQPKDYFGQTLSADDPSVADILGDGKPEILVPTNVEICVLSNTGVQLTDDGTHPPGAISFLTDGSLVNAEADDMESDGAAVEVVAVSGTPFPSYPDTKIFVWNPKAPAYPGTALKFHTIVPCRVIDTRRSAGIDGGPALTGNGILRTFPIEGRCGVPPDAAAVSANATVFGPSARGDLRIYPMSLTTPPSSSTINFNGGQSRANNLILSLTCYPPWGTFHRDPRRLGTVATGSIGVKCDIPAGATNFILDVNGYFK